MSNSLQNLTLREMIEKSRLETEVRATSKKPIQRRDFLKGIAAGSLVILTTTQGHTTAASAADLSTDNNLSPSLFVAIEPDGTVQILAHRSEMGTGIRTALPRVLADELGADWDRVVIRQAIGDKRLGDQNTDGSNSIRFFYKTMRVAGATARTMLQQAAAEKWDVSPERCTTKNNHVVLKGTRKSLPFGKLIPSAVKLEPPKPETLKFKSPEEFQYIGKNFPITDLDDILTGKATFGIDARIDGQLYAIIARCPVVGGTIASYDANAAKSIDGVVDVIELPRFQGAPLFQQLGGVAVVATSTWAAWQGRDALKAKWDEGPNADYDTKDFLLALKHTVKETGQVMRSQGDAADAIAKAIDQVAATYSVPHLSHAPMETTCAVADVKTNDSGDVVSCYLKAATQNPQAVQQAVGPAMGIPNDEVICDVTLLGAGFGRKSKPDYCVEAARLSRTLGKPVHVTWTREDDFRHDNFHTISAGHCEAGLDDAGNPAGWLMRAAYPSIGSTFNAAADAPATWEAEMGLSDLPYDVPNVLVEVGKAKAHTRIGWLRAVCHIFQNFAVSSFADELAHAAGKDPYQYLLSLLGEDRHLDIRALKLGNRGADRNDYPYDIGRLKNVLTRVARNSQWDRHSELPEGKGLGIACCRSFLGYTGHVVEVSVTQTGSVSVDNVWCSIDSGTIVSPDRVHAQVEGATIMGISQAFYGEMPMKRGKAVHSNFDGFQVARMSDAPESINIDIVESNAAPGGVGETGIGSFAPALCNAIFAATGKRVRDLPIKNHDLSWG
ncbi:MAG: molybdopterin-dependent oxidoreductase [Pirellulales bacterium]|nr:molybdopterin-dependent oxidoreductase [Pirellulales bacterium]